LWRSTQAMIPEQATIATPVHHARNVTMSGLPSSCQALATFLSAARPRLRGPCVYIASHLSH
jgi:hypothetical protein